MRRGSAGVEHHGMTASATPQEAASTVLHATLPPGDDERFVGYGVMGLPFAGGHYLALRHFPATSFSPGYPGYVAVWHRDSAGIWTFYATAPGRLSCARYLSSVTSNDPVQCDIDVTWTSPWVLIVRIPDVLDWQVELAATPATRLASTIGTRLPAWVWTNRTLLHALGRTAGLLLGAGRFRLTGTLPNRQYFMIAPSRVWAVTRSTAVLRGQDLGPIGPLPRQAQLGDFWPPQRGLFAVGQGHFETFDADRHLAVQRADA